MAIQKGSTVWLKIGSPKMITKRFDVFNDVWVCNWFVGNKMNEHSFSAEQLTETEPEDDLDDLL